MQPIGAVATSVLCLQCQALPAGTGFPRRWHELAGRKLVFYAELHRSGRWRLYFDSREKFVAHLTAAMQVENIWAGLAGGKAADDPVRPAA